MIIKNIIYSYISQIYLIGIGIIVNPVILTYMGDEQYGLISLYLVIFSYMGVLDLGLNTAVSREQSSYKVTNKKEEQQFVAIVEKIILLLGILISMVIYIYSSEIVEIWNKNKNLTLSQFKNVIILSIIILYLRWMSSYYRAVLTGQECFIWLSKFNIVIATLRYTIQIPIIIYYTNGIIDYFIYQLLIASIELFSLKYKSKDYIKLEKIAFKKCKEIINNNLKFSLAAGLSAIIWMASTQGDRILLTKYITLKNYGLYSFALMLASPIIMVGVPITSISIQHLVKTFKKLGHNSLIENYRVITKIVLTIVGALGFSIYFYKEEITRVFITNSEDINYVSNLLGYLALGNIFQTIAAFPYYLQYATGKLKLHLIGGIIIAIIHINVMYFTVIHYGAIGAATTWLAMNILTVFIWIPFVNHKIDKTLNKKWFINDVIIIIILQIFSIFLFKNISYLTDILFLKIIISIFAMIVTILISILIIREAREYLLCKIKTL